jgi:hypothetical protein
MNTDMTPKAILIQLWMIEKHSSHLIPRKINICSYIKLFSRLEFDLIGYSFYIMPTSHLECVLVDQEKIQNDICVRPRQTSDGRLSVLMMLMKHASFCLVRNFACHILNIPLLP